MAEGSIAKPEEYGSPFTWADFRRLRNMAEYLDSSVKLLIPTQKAITPDDARWLARDDAFGALMIGAIVTGTTVESVGAATAAYRAAIDSVDA
jgi:hypothetical protein